MTRPMPPLDEMPSDFTFGAAGRFQECMATSANPDSGALTLRSLFGDLDGPDLERVTSLFLDLTPQRVARAREASAVRDLMALERAAHSLKGSARSFGAAEMGAIAAEIEREAQSGTLDLVPELLDRLESAFDGARREIRALTGEAADHDEAADEVGAPVGTTGILIADDDADQRALIAETFAADPEYQVVGAAADADEAIQLAAATRPPLALVDWVMPRGGGPTAIAGILATSPRTRIVAMTAHDTQESRLEMTRAGALGFVVKGASAEEIRAALDSVSRY